MRSVLKLLRLTVVSLSLVPAVFGAQRTFVASYGLDSNPCTVAAPCRSFPAAIANTDAGGEVIVLDSAGYGSFTASQSVSVLAPSGIYAGISVFSGNGISVAGPGIRVVLDGVKINGFGGVTGIENADSESLYIRNCTIANMGGAGLEHRSTGKIFVSETDIRESASYGIVVKDGTAILDRVTSRNNRNHGIFVFNSETDPRATVTASSLIGNNGVGVFVEVSPGGSADVAIDRTTAASNANSGFAIRSNSGAGTLTVTRSFAAMNGRGVTSEGAGALAVVTESFLVQNAYGWAQSSGGVLRSMQNNVVEESENNFNIGVITAGAPQ